MPYKSRDEISHLAIFINPDCSFNEGRGATISVHTTDGGNMGEEYFLGTLLPDKPSCFVQIRPTAPGVDGLAIYITTRAEVTVKWYIELQKSKEESTGPTV
ncbi:hypothetical protein B0J13DRAFT_534893 [Dactylonectria estremocensis]|nr:hypothetical protein B0J13DRAFT_534893 [Dactylonectria estremocensis]